MLLSCRVLMCIMQLYIAEINNGARQSFIINNPLNTFGYIYYPPNNFMAWPLHFNKTEREDLNNQTDMKEDVMKIIAAILTVIVADAAPAIAAAEPETTGISLLMLLFIGFCALILVCQLIPSVMLFSSMLKGIFSSGLKHPLPKSGSRIP
jgi:hypothetical protein